MTRHDCQRLVVVIETLLLAHVCQAMLNILVADAMEIETLAAREDGLQNLLRVGGAQHKDHVCRRLLERLEQRVERRRREHVDLVDDIDLVLAAHRGKVDGVDDLLAHVVHAGTACGIELVDIRVVAAMSSHSSQVPSGMQPLAPSARAASALRHNSALARMRAMVVLPVPRGPQNR